MLSNTRSQRGSALPIAVGVLLVVTLIVGTVAALATRTSDEVNRDRAAKRALAAAEAGLRTATFRLNRIKPATNQCLTNVAVAPGAGGECPPYSEDIGNGATFAYYVTPALALGATCGKLPTDTSAGVHRCITSTGTVDGVQRRVQTRVSQDTLAPPLNPVEGIFGLKKVDIGNNADVGGDVGSNGQIAIGNNGTIEVAQLGPSGTLSAKKLTQDPSSPVVHPAPFTLGPVPIAGTEDTNDNIKIPGGSGYTAATRDLQVTSNLVLPGGTYNFCRIAMDGSGGISAAPGATVRIFLDAPSAVRPASGCQNGGDWGEMSGANGIDLGWPGGQPEQLQIYVHGWPNPSAYATANGRNTITVAKNNLQANAWIYAPNSLVHVAKNNATINGAIAAEEVYVKNNLSFNWDEDVAWIGGDSGAAKRRGWFECRPQPTNPSDPESGC